MEVKKCSLCNQPIGLTRLQAVPTTNVCAKCISKDRDDVDYEWIDLLDDIENVLIDLDARTADKVRQILQPKLEKMKNIQEWLNQDVEQLKQAVKQKVLENFEHAKTEFQNEKKEFEYEKTTFKKQLEQINAEHYKKESELNKQIETLKQQINSLAPNFVMDGQIELIDPSYMIGWRSPDIRGTIKINNAKYSMYTNVSLWVRQNTNISSERKVYAGYINKKEELLTKNKIEIIKEIQRKRIKGQIRFFSGETFNILIDPFHESFDAHGRRHITGCVLFFTNNQ